MLPTLVKEIITWQYIVSLVNCPTRQSLLLLIGSLIDWLAYLSDTKITRRYSTTLHYCLSAGNVKSDYFQWQKIDDLGGAASNLLLLVFFDVLAFVFTCIVVFFLCKINLIQVSHSIYMERKNVLFFVRSGFMLSKSLDWSLRSIKRSYWTTSFVWWKVSILLLESLFFFPDICKKRFFKNHLGHSFSLVLLHIVESCSKQD